MLLQQAYTKSYRQSANGAQGIYQPTFEHKHPANHLIACAEV